MHQYIFLLLFVFASAVSTCLSAQSLRSSLYIHAGLQTGLSSFKTKDEYKISLDDSPVYIAPYISVGLKSDEAVWGFRLSINAPLREYSYRDDLYRPGGPIIEVPYFVYSFRSISFDTDVTYALTDRFSVTAGPFIQVLYSAEKSINRYRESLNNTNSLIGLSAGVNVKFGRATVGAFYASTMRKVDVFTARMNYQSAQVTLGYLIVK